MWVVGCMVCMTEMDVDLYCDVYDMQACGSQLHYWMMMMIIMSLEICDMLVIVARSTCHNDGTRGCGGIMCGTCR